MTIELFEIPTWAAYAKVKHYDIRKYASNPIHPLAPQLNDKISLYVGDSSNLKVDAIVNAANQSLLGGGGIDGAIHRAAGPQLVKYCRKLNGCETGCAKITPGFKLPAKYIIHTVGPIGENPSQLKSCYDSCMDLVVENHIRSIAFCSISTGIYGYPVEAATHIALSTIRCWLDVPGNADKVDRIIFVNFLPKMHEVYERLASLYFPPYDPDSMHTVSEVNQPELAAPKEVQEEEKNEGKEEEKSGELPHFPSVPTDEPSITDEEWMSLGYGGMRNA
eukprot:GCRY01002619.1.p1 GENE.GCRY01002619.1~~GCRY01002619.1.p1  ORF type:complete len:277 (+),score=36.76 GCRY01002619.1:96-926(+)